MPKHPYEGQLHCDESGQWWEYCEGEWQRWYPAFA